MFAIHQSPERWDSACYYIMELDMQDLVSQVIWAIAETIIVPVAQLEGHCISGTRVVGSIPEDSQKNVP